GGEYVARIFGTASHIDIVILDGRIPVKFVLPIQYAQFLGVGGIRIFGGDVIAQVVEPTFVENIIKPARRTLGYTHILQPFSIRIGNTGVRDTPRPRIA